MSSSKTCYCSSFSQASLQDPLDQYSGDHINPSSLAAAHREVDALSLEPDASGLPHQRHISGNAVERYCPSCDETFKRLHDLKRHVKRYCCGRKPWICRNPYRSNYASQEKQANTHRYHGGNPICRQHGWVTIDRRCERKHFGCCYCAKYFDDLDNFVHHLGKDCGPDKVGGRGHQILQIIALLQQPTLKPHVEALCSELRGSRGAYQRLHCCWRKDKMAKIIDQLEYGPKARVSLHDPGIAVDQLDAFLRDLIAPSKGSRDVAELAREFGLTTKLGESTWKPLPPLSEPGQLIEPNAQQQELETEPYRCHTYYSEGVNFHVFASQAFAITPTGAHRGHSSMEYPTMSPYNTNTHCHPDMQMKPTTIDLPICSTRSRRMSGSIRPTQSARPPQQRNRGTCLPIHAMDLLSWMQMQL